MMIFIILLFVSPFISDQAMERNFFFKQPRETRMSRMRQLPLQDQYRVYRFGHDKIEPPALELATPIAEKGPRAVPFLKQKLQEEDDDVAVRDILYLFQKMLWLNTFDIRSDPALIHNLEVRIPKIKNANVQYSSRTMLEQIKTSPEVRK